MNWIIDETENEFIIKIKQLNLKKENFKLVRFGDYFKQVKKTVNYSYTSTGENTGIYPHVISTSLNNGVKFYSDFWNIKASKSNPIISINNDGSAGYTFIQTRDFSANSHVKLFKPKNNELNLIITCILLTNQFKKIKYSFNQPTLSMLTHDFNYDVFVYFN